jgi:hypothetical protein
MTRKELVSRVSKKVYRKHPEFKGVKPKVRKRSHGGGSEGYVMIYQADRKGPGNQTLKRTLRVVVSEKGTIQKMSTSR